MNNTEIQKKLLLLLKTGQFLTATGAALGLPALAYARFIEPNWLEVSHPTVKVDELAGVPPEIKGFKVSFWSDLHLPNKGAASNTLWQAAEKTLLERPDLLLLGGDMFDHGKYNPVMADLMRVITGAGIPVRAVFGNHDYFGRRGEYLRMMKNLEAVGIRFLINKAEPFNYKGTQIWLAGVDDFSKGEPDVPETASFLPSGVKPLLLITHNPATVRTLPQDFTHVMLSGHTHGGQINPALGPFNRKLNWITFKKGGHHYSEFPLGWYNLKGIRLYVGKGLGMSGMNLRFNSRPELVMLQFV